MTKQDKHIRSLSGGSLMGSLSCEGVGEETLGKTETCLGTQPGSEDFIWKGTQNSLSTRSRSNGLHTDNLLVFGSLVEQQVKNREVGTWWVSLCGILLRSNDQSQNNQSVL